jgi:hypothetical protein
MMPAEPAAKMPAVTAVAVYVVAAVVASTTFPLLSYTASLACFGLLHVLVELRYVERRFSASLPPSLWRWAFALIAGVVALRGLRVAAADIDIIPAELILVAGLVVVGVVVAGRVGAGVVGVVVATFIVVGAATAPLETLLVLAVTHNFTPVGFIVERAPPGKKSAALLVSLAVFIGAPGAVASGVAADVLGAAGVSVDVASRFFSAKTIDAHFGVYLWPSMADSEHAVSLFAGAVCAQLLHYGAVILWLPWRAAHTPERLFADDNASVVVFFVVVVVVAVVGLAAHFAVDFAGARGFYGLPAAVHAWLELPVLLVALGGLRARRR